VYERVKDYWGNAVNVNIGRGNFDELEHISADLNRGFPILRC